MADLQPQPAPQDEGAAFWANASQDQQKAQALHQAISYGMDQNPEEYAKALRLAAQTGVAPALAQDKSVQPAINKAAEMQRWNFEQFLQASPRTAGWLSNPNNAAVAHDDAGTLAQLEDATSQLLQTPQRAMGSLFSAMGGGARLLGSLSEAAQHPGATLTERMLGQAADLFTNGQGQNWRESGEDVQNYYRPLTEGPAIQQGSGPLDWMTARPSTKGGRVAGIVSGIAGTMGKAILEGPAAPLMFGAEAAGAKAGAALDTGATPTQAALEAGGSGALNTALGGLTLPGSSAGQSLLRSILTRGAKGVGLATVTTPVENLLTRIHKPDQPLWEGYGENVASFLGMEGAGLVGEHLGQMFQAAAESKLKARSPEAFQDAVGNILKDSAAEQIQIPAPALARYFQSQNIDPDQGAEALGIRNWQEAKAAGTDALVPTDAFLAKLDPEAHQALLPDIRVRPGDATLNELKDQAQQLADFGPKLQAQADQVRTEIAADPVKQQIFDETKARFEEAGFEPSTADAYAQAHTQAMTTLAERSGQDPLAMHEKYGPDIFRVRPGEDVTDAILRNLAAQGNKEKFHQGPVDGEPPKGIHFDDLPKEQQDRVVDGIHQDIQHWSDHPEEFHKAYEADPETFGGRLVNGDIMRRSLPTVAKNVPLGLEAGKHTDTAIESLMVTLHQRLVSRALDLAGDKPVGITAGGQASGKTRLANHILSQDRVGAVIDAPHDSLQELNRFKRQILERGNDAYIYYLDRPDFKASTRSMIGRMISEGRPVDPHDMAGKTLRVPDEILKFGEENRNQPRVHLIHVTNSEGTGWEAVGGSLANDGKDAMSSIRAREFPSKDDLVSQAKEAYVEYQRDAQNGSAEPIPADSRRSLEATFNGGVDEFGGGSEGLHGRGQEAQRASAPVSPQAGYDRLASALKALGISPDGDASDIRRQLAEKSQDPTNQQKVQDVVSAMRDVGTTLLQGNGDRDFGSKAWQEYYGLTRGASRPVSDMAQRARAAARASETQRGIAGFDAQRELEMKTDEELFRAWNDQVKGMQAGEVHGEDNRGFLQFGEDRRMNIGLLQKADLSTVIHELGHMHVEIMGDLAAAPDAPEQIKQDYQTLREFAGATGDEPLTRDQHETLARAEEAYMMEGKAPSEGLRGVFQRFKGWMQLVYQKLTSLGVKLSPEVRGVFDRMYASDAEIERAHQNLGDQNPMFADAKTMGVSEAEFELYQKNRAQELEAAKEDLQQQVLDEFKREKERAWKDERDQVKQEAAAQLEQDPVYRAHRALVEGKLEDGTPIKLDRQQLVDRLGEDATKGIPRGKEAVYTREGGMDLQTAAELMGFHSGDDLAHSLAEMEPRREAIERMADETMQARHGSMLTDGTAADGAVAALHNRFREDALAMELKALRAKQAEVAPFVDLQAKLDAAKSDEERKLVQDAWAQVKAEQAHKAGEEKAAGRAALTVPPMDAFRTAARAFINDTAVKDLTPQRFLDGQRMASRESAQALIKKDFQTAGDAKQKEILNHFLYKEALAAQKDVGKFEDFAKRLQSTAGQQRLGKAGGSYRDQINALLGRYEMTDKGQLAKASNKELARRESLIEWSQRLHEDGKEPAIDPTILNEARQINYRQVPMSEVRALHDALKNINHLAGQELGMIVNGKRIDFEQSRDEMIQSLRANFESKPLPLDINMPKGFGEKAADLAHRGDAMLVKMERLMDWMDGGKLDGPWHRNIWDNIADAQGREYDLASKITEKLGDALENMPKEQRENLLETHDIEGLGRVTKKFILSAAMNLGNEDNQTKLLKGMGWSPETLGKMMDHMTREDWGFVQQTWDTLQTLWPEIAALEQRMTGLEPPKVQARPFEATLADGSKVPMAGGYYPVMYDPERSAQGAKQAAGDVSKMFEAGYARATTPKGHTKERVDTSIPMLMDFNQVLTAHTTKVIKDLTHREAVVAANKLITDKDIRSALQETLGPAYEKQMLPWLRGVVNDRNGSSTQGLGDFSRWMMTLRSNTVAATMAFKATTMLLQMTHIPRMLLYVKPGEFTGAMVDFLAHPKAMTDQVRGLSPNEMAFRGENLDRDIRQNLLNETGEKSLKHDATRMGMHGVAMIDHLVSVPLWLGVYRQSLKAGMEDSLAVNAADRAVRLGMGAGSPKDLPAIMRQNDATKLLTMFYGFHNGIYNQLRDAGHQVQGISDMGKFLGTGALTVLAPAILSQLVMGKGPGKDDNPALWAIWKSLLFGGDTIPILRDVASAFDRGSDYKFSPIATAMELGVKASEQAAKPGPKDWGPVAMEAGNSLGYLFGVPGSAQATKTAGYLWKVHEGKQPIPTPMQALRNITLGPPPKEGR